MEYTVNRKASGKIKIVLQIDPDTKEVLNEFYSVRKAANALGIPTLFSNIAKSCREGRICSGYLWRYETLNSDK